MPRHARTAPCEQSETWDLGREAPIAPALGEQGATNCRRPRSSSGSKVNMGTPRGSKVNQLLSGVPVVYAQSGTRAVSAFTFIWIPLQPKIPQSWHIYIREQSTEIRVTGCGLNYIAERAGHLNQS